MLGKASTEMEVRRIATVIYKVRIGTVRYKMRIATVIRYGAVTYHENIELTGLGTFSLQNEGKRYCLVVYNKIAMSIYQRTPKKSHLLCSLV